jgi:nitrite reductase/ring-hydroxylating ferredoxin subunit
MTSAAEGELLTRVGPGTAMGRLMREYWVPAALSSELIVDAPPIRLMLLGEKLVAFRDSRGRVGVLDHRCPHRCASLFLGRNEKGGLRCAYHGWQFDVGGNCLDMPNVPPVDPEEADPTSLGRYAVLNRAPDYHVADTDWGTMYAAYRPAEPGATYWRFAHFMFPFWTITPDSKFTDQVLARAWVPMDDKHTMFVNVSWKKSATGLRKLKNGSPIPGVSIGPKLQPNGTGWFDRWWLVADAENDYLIDRDLQRAESYSGIDGIYLQDQAVTESMGDIVDHTFEHLAISDLMITPHAPANDPSCKSVCGG